MPESKQRSFAFILTIMMLITSVATASVTTNAHSAFAQSIEIDAGLDFAGTTTVSRSSSSSIALWIPPKLLAGENYSGVVTVTEAESYDRDVLLVSDNPGVVRVPERVTIKADMHQAVFNIKAAIEPLSRSSVTASVSAVVSGGVVSRTTSTVYDASVGGGNVIRLLAFGKTALSFARVVVVAPESSGGDYDADEDDGKTTTVTLVYPAGTSRVTIDSRTGYGVADVPLVDGENRISVFGRPGDTIAVTRVPVDPAITVKISSLSTVPAWSPEWGYQRSWVLVDAERNGKPIRGGGDNSFTVTATSSDPDVLEVEQAFWRKSSMLCDLPCAIPIRG